MQVKSAFRSSFFLTVQQTTHHTWYNHIYEDGNSLHFSMKQKNQDTVLDWQTNTNSVGKQKSSESALACA